MFQSGLKLTLTMLNGYLVLVASFKFFINLSKKVKLLILTTLTDWLIIKNALVKC